LAPPPSPPPQKVPLLPPPAFDDDDDDADDARGLRGHRQTPLPAPPPPFQRQSAGRCSVQQPMMTGNHHYRAAANCPDVSEYFIPRSASAHDLCSSVDAHNVPPPLPPSVLRTAAATLARPPRPQTVRDKMVTFEDEKLAHDQQQRYKSSGDLIV